MEEGGNGNCDEKYIHWTVPVSGVVFERYCVPPVVAESSIER